jgi:peptide/nickel transport system substrate-binding protein
MDATPVGTGPFRFVSYELEQRLTLVKNEAYHAGPPKIAGVVVTFIPDETVRTLELEAGGVDIVMNPITPDLLPRLRRQDHLKIETRVGTNYSYLGFNLHDPVVGRRAVREALAHAIDRQAIVDHILKGLAAVAAGPLSPSNPYYVADLPVYDYDPAKAARLLDAAGFPDPDGDGPASRMRLNYATSQNELRKRIAEVFQYQLAKIGVELVIDSMEWGTFFGRIQKGEFQVYSLTWVGIVDPDIFHNIFHSASLPPGGANRGGYVDADIDRLLDEGRRVVGDKRNEVYAEAQRIVARDLPYVSLWHGVNVAVANRRVTGFVVTPDENLKSVVGVTLAEEKP